MPGFAGFFDFTSRVGYAIGEVLYTELRAGRSGPEYGVTLEGEERLP
jgi:hypothetical protein